MLRYVPIGLAAWMLCAAGCASRGNAELLEAQLRRQEDQLYAMHAKLTQSESELTLARREMETLRVALAERGERTLLPEQSRLLHRLAGVRVQKYFSGGLNRDEEPGDDLLNVVVVPHDEDGETVKSPGELEIEAIDLSAPEHEQQLGVWRFSSEEVARHWHSGLTTGFQFRMPWQMPPASENIVLHARFRTLDGRQFGTSTEIQITPNPEVVARAQSRRLASQRGELSKPEASAVPDALPPGPLPLPGESAKDDAKLPPFPEPANGDPLTEATPFPVQPAGADEFDQESTWTPLEDQVMLEPAGQAPRDSKPDPFPEWETPDHESN